MVHLDQSAQHRIDGVQHGVRVGFLNRPGRQQIFVSQHDFRDPLGDNFARAQREVAVFDERIFWDGWQQRRGGHNLLVCHAVPVDDLAGVGELGAFVVQA